MITVCEGWWLSYIKRDAFIAGERVKQEHSSEAYNRDLGIFAEYIDSVKRK